MEFKRKQSDLCACGAGGGVGGVCGGGGGVCGGWGLVCTRGVGD